MTEDQNVYYGDYLQLDKLLDAQKPYSAIKGEEAHDEMLFIITHQVYELWFKQINHELKLVSRRMGRDHVEERKLGRVVSALQRIEKIQDILIKQLCVMETMTPMDFLDFRNLLVPASGFQSQQFREIEVRLGLKTNQRKGVDREYFLGRLSEEDRERVMKTESEVSLIDAVNDWLERLPFTDAEGFQFWHAYKDAVDNMISEDEEIVRNNKLLTQEQIDANVANLELSRANFNSLFDEDIHNEIRESGKRRLSHKATLNALFVLSYRDEAILSQPFQILTSLMNIDENFSRWRYRHALMAQRMLGVKVGTGGSSGHNYLKSTVKQNKVFVDLFNLSTFLIPSSKLPELPKKVLSSMNFSMTEGKD